MDWRFFTLALAVPLTACHRPAPNTDHDGREIVGGVAENRYPAIGAILEDGAPVCTGTLIGPKQVLTAAHCLLSEPWRLSFAIGRNAYDPDDVIAVASVHPHPDYNDYTLWHDVGYLTLDDELTTRPLELVAWMTDDWIGRQLTFVGYGVTDGYTQSGAGRKRSVRMPIDGMDDETFWFGTEDENICDGDSGGPVLYDGGGSRPSIAGLISSGLEGCDSYSNATRVDTYLDFIQMNGSPAEDPCGDETYAGRCTGDLVVWCEDDAVWEYDCADDGFVCGAVDGGYDCTEGEQIVVDGVVFTRGQADAIVQVANSASRVVLDDEIGLDRRAADGIIAERPFDSLAEVGEVSYVGPAALQAMLDYAP